MLTDMQGLIRKLLELYFGKMGVNIFKRGECRVWEAGALSEKTGEGTSQTPAAQQTQKVTNPESSGRNFFKKVELLCEHIERRAEFMDKLLKQNPPPKKALNFSKSHGCSRMEK